MDTTERALRVAANGPPRSAGHAAFALTGFMFADLVETGVIPRQRAALMLGRAAAWLDREDPVAASMIDALGSRVRAG